MRADKWLWMTRFFRSRSLAAEVLAGLGLRINGQKTDRPAHALRPGDVLTFVQAGTVRVVRVTALPQRRGPASEAQACYDDLAPASAEAAGANAALEPITPLA